MSILDNFLKPTDAAYKKIEKLISSIKSLNTTSHPQPQGNKVISQGGVEKRNLKPIHPTSSKFVEDANVNYFILSRNYLPIKMRETLSRKVITFQKVMLLVVNTVLIHWITLQIIDQPLIILSIGVFMIKVVILLS